MAITLPVAPVRKLGAKAPDPRKLRRALPMGNYLIAANLPPPPPTADWLTKVATPYPTFLNTQIGDCTCAAKAKAIEVWSSANGAEVTVQDQTVLAMYVALTGEEGAAYDPSTGANDNGATVIDSLDYFRQQGLEGCYLDAYLAFNVQSQMAWQQAISLFGVVDTGLALPLAAQNQQVWDVPHGHVGMFHRKQYEPGSWGGHDAIFVGYNATGPIVFSWDQKIQVTWAWVATYCQEAYALYSKLWLNGPNGISPSQLDDATLQRDLQLVQAA